MCNIQMIREERGLISIPVQKAVFCENCEQISNSAWLRCGRCGSETIVELLNLFRAPSPPDPQSPATAVAVLREAA